LRLNSDDLLGDFLLHTWRQGEPAPRRHAWIINRPGCRFSIRRAFWVIALILALVSAWRSRFTALWLGAAARRRSYVPGFPARNPPFELPQETVPSRRPEAEMVDRW